MRKLIAIIFMVPAMAYAEFWTGNNLYQRMTSSDMTDRIQAMGYVMGVYDVGVHAMFCPQDESGITVGQITDMAKNWLAANAHRRHESAEKLVRESSP